MHQLVADLRADEFHLAQFGRGILFFQDVHGLVGKLGRCGTCFVRQADHQVLVGSQGLNLNFAQLQAV